MRAKRPVTERVILRLDAVTLAVLAFGCPVDPTPEHAGDYFSDEVGVDGDADIDGRTVTEGDAGTGGDAVGSVDADIGEDVEVDGDAETDGDVPADGVIRFVSDFETGVVQPDGRTDGWRLQVCEEHSLNIVQGGEMGAPPPRDGLYMARFELRPTDRSPSACTTAEGSDRAEVWTDQDYLSLEGDNWIGISMYMPSESWDPGADRGMIIFQIHGCEGDGPSPCLVLNGSSESWGGYYRANQELSRLFSVPIVLDRWVDFVLMYRPSTGDDGLIQIWIDGVEVATATGPNMTPEANPYTKTGIYRTVTTTLVSFRDSIRIANCERGEDCYHLVAP